MSIRRPDLVLGASVLVSLPIVPGVLDGAISPTDALVRYLGALVVCWMGGSLIGSILAKYTKISRRKDVIKAIEIARQQQEEEQARFREENPTSFQTHSQAG
jgi:hypothetical protein